MARVLNILIRHDGGGAERAVRLISNELIRTPGFEVCSIAIDPPAPGEGEARGPVLNREKYRGIRRIAVSSLRLRSIVSEWSPDIIHLHCEAPELVFALATVLRPVAHVPVVVTEHSEQAWKGRRAHLRDLIRSRCSGQAAVYKVVDCFPGEADRLYIPNPVAAPIISRRASEPRILVVGRLIPSKRVDEVLLAAAQARWPGPVIIVGDGPDRPNLERKASELGLKCDFLGFRPSAWSVACHDDVLVTASEFEGDPLTVLEATSAGLPTLASDISAHRRILGQAHPGLFRDRADLVDKMLRIGVSRDSYRPSSDARREALRREPSLIAASWRQLYSTLLSPETR